MKRPPKLCRNKYRNSAFVIVNGKQIYLGKWGSPEAQAAYDRFLLEWMKNRNRPQKPNYRPGRGIMLVEMVVAYIAEYRERPVKNRSDLNTFILLGKRMAALFPDYETDDFRIRDLEMLRDSFQKEGFNRGGEHRDYCRTYLNKLVNRVKTIFAWGVSKEMVSAETCDRLKYLQPLRKGRTTAPEPEARHLVSPSDYRAVLDVMPFYYRDIIEILRFTGMRPSELINMRVGEIDRAGEIWIYRPPVHKTEHSGNVRAVAIGKNAQKLLAPHLDGRRGDEYVFTPSRAMESLWKTKRVNRKTRVQPSQEKRAAERAGKYAKYSPKLAPDAVRKAVARACTKAIEAGTLVQPWTPYELRHTAITEVRTKFGAEAAQHFAGHANLNTQRFYDHSALITATAVAKEIG